MRRKLKTKMRSGDGEVGEAAISRSLQDGPEKAGVRCVAIRSDEH